MTPEALSAAASLLYGDRWQHSLSIALRVDYRLVRRWAQGYRPIPAWVPVRLRELLIERRHAIESALRPELVE